MKRAFRMMWWVASAVFAFAVLAVPGTVDAQVPATVDAFCGGSCLKCEGAPSPDYKYGGGGGHQNYLAFCSQGSCTTCRETLLAETPSERSNSVAMKLRSATNQEFARVASQHKAEIRVDVSRSIAVVLGGCDGNAVESVIVLRPEQMAELRRLKVRTLASHMALSRKRMVAGT